MPLKLVVSGEGSHFLVIVIFISSIKKNKKKKVIFIFSLFSGYVYKPQFDGIRFRYAVFHQLDFLPISFLKKKKKTLPISIKVIKINKMGISFIYPKVWANINQVQDYSKPTNLILKVNLVAKTVEKNG